MLGRIEGRRRRTTENEMVGWHHQLNGHEFEKTLGDSGGQRRLVCYSLWGHKESDMTWRPNNNNKFRVQKELILLQNKTNQPSFKVGMPMVRTWHFLGN